MNRKVVKHLILPLHEKLLGRETFPRLRELQELQWGSREAIEHLQFKKLKDLLRHAGENIPFYRERFAGAGFEPDRMSSVEGLRVLPLLDKAEIRQNLDSMLWRDSPGGLHRYNTGGSSGEPLIFYFDRRRQAYDAAARALTHQWFGVDIGDKELYLWGSPVEIKKQDRLKQLRDYLTNDLLISAFELSPENVPEILRRFRKFRPKCVFGYPSTISLFCKMADELGFSLRDMGVGVVFSTAEVLYEEQKETIRSFFGGVPVADCYGSREGGFVSHQCEHGTYHVLDPNYILEYIKEDGEHARPGEEGEIVLTHLDAWGMPFIRYRTGDVARPGHGNCPCGRSWSIMDGICGRTTDFIVTPDGRWQHALSLIYVVRDIQGVEEFKIIQEAVDHIRILLKSREEALPGDGCQTIIRGIKKRMGEDVRVEVEMVEAVPRDKSGKYRYVVSKVAGQ